jgi:hypothetical protein
MNAGTSGIKILLFSIILILQVQNVFAQSHYLDSYPGIPIIAHTNRTANQITPGNLQKMKELGVMGFYATDLTTASYNTITDSGLKVFPYQLSGNNWIVYYTDAIYTKWEAEGKGDGSNGDMQLYHNTSISLTFTEGSKKGIKTSSSNAGNLTFGPYYYQYVEYKQLPIDPLYPQIQYSADFELKIVNKIPIQDLPAGYENTLVCTLKVVATNPALAAEQQEHTIESRELFVRDFLPPNGNGWNQWKTISIANYDLTTLVNLSAQQLKGIYYNGSGNNTNPTYDSRWMQYKIDWAGVSFLDLYVDNITISDQKGRLIKDNTTARNQVKTLVAQYPDTSTVLGWFGLNEPFSIDNYEPFSIVDGLVQDTNATLHLFTTFTTGWGGVYGMPYPGSFGDNGYVYKGSEFIKRSKLPYLSLNLYNYNFPYYPWETPDGSYYLKNIDYVTAENLHKLDSAGIPISYSTQSGKFYDFNLSCLDEFPGSINPSSEQMLYHINLGLLYGMKELTCDPLFTLYNSDAGRPCPDSLYRTGLIYYSDNSLTTLGITWRDKVKPRMSGLVGKTIRKLTPTEQYLNHTLSSSKNFIQSIIKGGCTVQGMQPGDEAYDLGFFKDDLDRDYFMLISRWYNPGCNPALTINIKPEYFSDYYNLKVVNLINNTTLATITKYGNIYAAPEVGDACFFSVTPVVKYGGLLAYNDTIKVNTTLADNMTIDAGKVLQINEGTTYTISDTITFADTSSFIAGYGYINRNQNGWITTRSWNKSLFKGRSGSHPKLIWSKHPDITNVIDYKIYRNHSNDGWQYLTSKSSSTFEYIDSTITILEGMPQANEVSTEYRVTATYRPSKLVIETSPSNTITYQRVEGQGLEKQNSGLRSNDFTYHLDQNYPNPFNPNTTINYSIAEDGLVEIEILNILGERIKTLVNEFKTKGNHNISFNASSLASGVYVYKLQAGDFISSKKMILLK